MIREALVEARTELEALRTREAELEPADHRCGDCPRPESSSSMLGERRMTLHDALARVLRESGNEGLTARELADAVNRRGLYQKRDGSPVEVNQVQARVNNYGSIFEKDGSVVRLLEESTMLSKTPQGFTIFRDDDDAFFEWLEEHPDGYFVNTARNPKPSYLVLHQRRSARTSLAGNHSIGQRTT